LCPRIALRHGKAGKPVISPLPLTLLVTLPRAPVTPSPRLSASARGAPERQARVHRKAPMLCLGRQWRQGGPSTLAYAS